MNSQIEFSFDNSPTESFIVAKNITHKDILQHEYKMLENNRINGLLDLSIRKSDDSFALYYKITSKQALTDLLKRRKVTKKEFLDILKGIISAIIFTEGFLLSGNGFILEESKIYIDPVNFKTYLMYIPVDINSNLNTSIKDMIIRLIVYHANIQNKDMDNFLQRILEFIRQDVYSLRELLALIEELGGNRSKEQVPIKPDEKKDNLVSKTENQTGIKNKNQTNSESKKPDKQKERLPVLLIGILQIGVIIGIFFAANYLKSYTEDTLSAYLGTAGIFFCLDFLALRKLFEKKGNIKGEKNQEKNNSISKMNNTYSANPVKNNVDAISKDKKESFNKKIEKSTPKADVKAIEEPVKNNYTDETCLLSADNKLNYPILTSNSSIEASRIEVNKNSFIIGRIEGQVDYVSKNKAVGKLHAEIVKRQDKYYLKDLNSKNGTFLNKIKISSNIEAEIKDNDNIQFANSEFIFRFQ